MQEYILSPLGLRNYLLLILCPKRPRYLRLVFAENLVIFIRNRKVVKALANYSFIIVMLYFYGNYVMRGKNLVPAWL